MNNLKGTKTEANLMAAFAGESQARNKYLFFATRALKEGYNQIAEIFQSTADNERAHAYMWFTLLHNGLDATEENLLSAANGENYEWSEMYAKFAADARQEGFENIARQFEGVAAIEKEHENRYRTYLNNIRNGLVFEKPTSVTWVCGNCGHTQTGTTAPAVCPVCGHPQAFFAVKPNNG